VPGEPRAKLRRREPPPERKQHHPEKQHGPGKETGQGGTGESQSLSEHNTESNHESTRVGSAAGGLCQLAVLHLLGCRRSRASLTRNAGNSALRGTLCSCAWAAVNPVEGLFRPPAGEATAERVGDRFQDTIGFPSSVPKPFLGSGHLDGRDDLPRS
jgi:hypothetical protein